MTMDSTRVIDLERVGRVLDFLGVTYVRMSTRKFCV